MAVNTSTTDTSAADLVKEVLLSILKDDGFTIPTAEAKLCLEISRSLLELFSQNTVSCHTHSVWLVAELNGVITQAKKRRSDLLNQEKLWSTYYQLLTSKTFQQKWEKFLSTVKLPQEPLLYQYVTAETFELLIKEKFSSSNDTSLDESVTNTLTFEEENAVRYVGGYVIRVINQKVKNVSIQKVLDELKSDEDTNGPAEEWISTIDRGGLTKITPEAYRCFRSIEMCIRHHLVISKAREMNESFKQDVHEVILNDDDVLFSWCLAGQIEGDAAADKCLSMIVDKWITIRGFSFAKTVLEE